MKIEKIITSNNRLLTSHHLQAEVICSFKDLTSLFGRPFSYKKFGSAIDVQWAFVLDSGEIVTLYNWKNGPNYMTDNYRQKSVFAAYARYRRIYKLKDITEWNIGAENPEPAYYIKRVIEERWESFHDIYKEMI